MTGLTRTLYVSILTVSLGTFLGCSISETEVEVPQGPRGFGFDQVTAVQSGDAVSKNGETLRFDCTEPLLVHVTPKFSDKALGDFELGAPGECGSTVNCGWLVLSVQDADGKRFAEIPSASSPIRVDIPVSHRNESVTFNLELRDATGANVLTETEQPLSAKLTLTLDGTDPTSASACNVTK